MDKVLGFGPINEHRETGTVKWDPIERNDERCNQRVPKGEKEKSKHAAVAVCNERVNRVMPRQRFRNNRYIKRGLQMDSTAAQDRTQTDTDKKQ